MHFAGSFLVNTIGGLELTKRVLSQRSSANIIYDSFRNIQEAVGMRRELGDRFQLIYLDTPYEVRLSRFLDRPDRENLKQSFEHRAAHETERECEQLKDFADLVIGPASVDKVVDGILQYLADLWGKS